LLVIAAVNVASLLLLRSESRRREIAVRNALGASAGRLVSQFVSEGLVLVAGGSLLGLACAFWVMELLTRLIPAEMFARMSFLHGPGLNARVLMFAGVIAVLAAVLFSLTPTLRLSLSDMRDGLVEGTRGSAGNAWRRLGSRLVVLELATAMVLLAGAGLLGKSLYQLLRVDIGMEPDHLATMDLAAPKLTYPGDEQASALARHVVNRIAALPGVESVSASNMLPVGSNGNTTWFRVIGRPYHGEHNETPEREVSPDYFRTLGAKLVRGRYFTEAEDTSKPRVVIVNEALMRRYFPGEDPIGQHITYLSDPPVPIEIVGIVGDVKEGPLDTATPPVLYLPFSQSPERFFSVIVRTSQAEQSILPTLAAVIRQIDPDIITSTGMTMNDRIGGSPSVYLHRSSAWLVGGFAVPALLLGVIGLYGVIAYSVSQRSREIGVRMALGARPASVYRLIMREAGWLTAAGIAIGLACAVAAATLMRRLLFGVESWDVATLVAVAAVLGLSALLASYVPARRAALVNPVDALRGE
jgi:predicted permease